MSSVAVTTEPLKQRVEAAGGGGGEAVLRGGAFTKPSRTLFGSGVLVGIGLGEVGKLGELGGLIPMNAAGPGAGTATTVGAGVVEGAAVIVGLGTAGAGAKLATGAGAGDGGALQSLEVPLRGCLHVSVHCDACTS